MSTINQLAVFAIGRNSPDGVQLLGTGFGVTPSIVASAAHVVGRSDEGLVAVFPNISLSTGYQDTTDSTLRAVPIKIVAINPIRDVALLEFFPAMTYGKCNIGSADSVGVGSPITTFGYPHADTGRLVLTQHSGIVGAKILLGSASLKVKHLVLNIQTRTGQSGSPVVVQGVVCGMVVGAYRPEAGIRLMIGELDPSTLHQTTHAVSAEYISEML